MAGQPGRENRTGPEGGLPAEYSYLEAGARMARDYIYIIQQRRQCGPILPSDESMN